MLPEIYTNVRHASDSRDLLNKVIAFAHWLGFDTVTVTAVVDQLNRLPEFFSVANPPKSYVDIHDDPAMWACDPVLQHLRRSSLPIAWNCETYVASGQGAKWELQAGHGYSCGLAVAMHLPRGRHFFIGLDRKDQLPRSADEIARLLGCLQLFAAHAETAASALLVHEAMKPIVLSWRELEALRWTMDGKTAWEVANILGISEQTAVRHLQNATRKLDCANKQHAVAKAMRLGLLQ